MKDKKLYFFMKLAKPDDAVFLLFSSEMMLINFLIR